MLTQQASIRENKKYPYHNWRQTVVMLQLKLFSAKQQDTDIKIRLVMNLHFGTRDNTLDETTF